MNTTALYVSEVSFSGRCRGSSRSGAQGEDATHRYLVGSAAASSLRSSSGCLLDVPFTQPPSWFSQGEVLMEGPALLLLGGGVGR